MEAFSNQINHLTVSDTGSQSVRHWLPGCQTLAPRVSDTGSQSVGHWLPEAFEQPQIRCLTPVLDRVLTGFGGATVSLNTVPKTGAKHAPKPVPRTENQSQHQCHAPGTFPAPVLSAWHLKPPPTPKPVPGTHQIPLTPIPPIQPQNPQFLFRKYSYPLSPLPLTPNPPLPVTPVFRPLVPSWSRMHRELSRFQAELLHDFTQDLKPINSLERALIEQMAITQAQLRWCFGTPPNPDWDNFKTQKWLQSQIRLMMQLQIRMQAAHRKFLTGRRNGTSQPNPDATPYKPTPEQQRANTQAAIERFQRDKYPLLVPPDPDRPDTPFPDASSPKGRSRRR
jgi:hypothetical protein